MKNDRLTEDNLKKLDERIFKESELRDKKDTILDDRKSTKSGGQVRSASQKAPGADNQDARSVASSRMSGASGLSHASKKAGATGAKKDYDTYSIRSGSQGAKTEVYSELDENDEWTAI